MYSKGSSHTTALKSGGTSVRVKLAKSSNSTADPIKDAYRLKSQIDAVQKSQQSFKTSEIIQIQNKLLNKAWKWISKYGIGSFNQYTRMKRQIHNHDAMIHKLSAIQSAIDSNFKSLLCSSKHHTNSLHRIESQLYPKSLGIGTDKDTVTKIDDAVSRSHDGLLDEAVMIADSTMLHSESLSSTTNTNNALNRDSLNQPNCISDDQDLGNKSNSNSMMDRPQILLLSHHSDDDHSDHTLRENENLNHNNHNDPIHPMHDQMENVRDRHESYITMNSNEESMMKKGIPPKRDEARRSKSDGCRPENVDSKQKKEKTEIEEFGCSEEENKIIDDIMGNLTKLESLSVDFGQFIESELDRHKTEIQHVITSKLRPLHEILDQRELGLLSELRYLHKEHAVKIKNFRFKLLQKKKFVKMKLVQFQNVCQQSQVHWERQYGIWKNGHCELSLSLQHEHSQIGNESMKQQILDIKASLVDDRKQKLITLGHEVEREIEIDSLQKAMDDIKRLYIFTVNSTEMSALKQRLQTVGEFVDFSASNKNHIASTSSGNILSKMGSSDVDSDIEPGGHHHSKLSNIINKKFHELIGRRVSHSPSESGNMALLSQLSGSLMSPGHSSCNLDHIIADDAISIGSDDDGEEEIGVDIMKVVNEKERVIDVLDHSLSQISNNTVVHREKKTSVVSTVSENAASSVVNSDLP